MKFSQTCLAAVLAGAATNAVVATTTTNTAYAVVTSFDPSALAELNGTGGVADYLGGGLINGDNLYLVVNAETVDAYVARIPISRDCKSLIAELHLQYSNTCELTHS